MDLICISLKISEAEHHFMGLVVIDMSLKKYTSDHFLSGFFVFYMLSNTGYFNILDIISLFSDIMFSNIFSHSVD